MNLIYPLAPFSNWHLIPVYIVLAIDPRYSGSHISGWPVSESFT